MLDIDIPTSFDVGCGEGALPAQSGNLASWLIGGVMRHIYGLPNLGLSTSFHEVEA
jgi:hypothetical protein